MPLYTKSMSLLISVRFILAYQVAITGDSLTSILKVQHFRLQFKKNPYLIINICNIHTIENVIFKIIPQDSSQDIK